MLFLKTFIIFGFTNVIEKSHVHAIQDELSSVE